MTRLEVRERQNFRAKRDGSRESERGLDARKRRGIYPIYMTVCSVHVMHVNGDELCVLSLLNKFVLYHDDNEG